MVANVKLVDQITLNLVSKVKTVFEIDLWTQKWVLVYIYNKLLHILI